MANVKTHCTRVPLLPRSRRGIVMDFTDHPSMTRQEFKDECDINNIMKRYLRTGVINHLNRHEGRYGDFPAADFQSALELVHEGRALFDELPAKVRARFDNNPGSFLAFVQDEGNREEATMLGLLEAPTEPASEAGPPVDPPTDVGDVTEKGSESPSAAP